ncbi:hypothetical protein [Amycolatopsis samaneae]|uniref:Uncharacterized protein n=1 Tax=Amycolatopsis samaneae TaxID=664691 RepID=A0ABW5GU47_9PSEU
MSRNVLFILLLLPFLLIGLICASAQLAVIVWPVAIIVLIVLIVIKLAK